MALVRCSKCGCPIGKSGNHYAEESFLAVGHPDSGLVCGSRGCENCGLVWLTEVEKKE